MTTAYSIGLEGTPMNKVPSNRPDLFKRLRWAFAISMALNMLTVGWFAGQWLQEPETPPQTEAPAQPTNQAFDWRDERIVPQPVLEEMVSKLIPPTRGADVMERAIMALYLASLSPEGQTVLRRHWMQNQSEGTAGLLRDAREQMGVLLNNPDATAEDIQQGYESLHRALTGRFITTFRSISNAAAEMSIEDRQVLLTLPPMVPLPPFQRDGRLMRKLFPNSFQSQGQSFEAPPQFAPPSGMQNPWQNGPTGSGG